MRSCLYKAHVKFDSNRMVRTAINRVYLKVSVGVLFVKSLSSKNQYFLYLKNLKKKTRKISMRNFDIRNRMDMERIWKESVVSNQTNQDNGKIIFSGQHNDQLLCKLLIQHTQPASPMLENRSGDRCCGRWIYGSHFRSTRVNINRI